MRGSKIELAELGEEEDQFTKSTSKLRDTVKAMTGFDIMENDSQYKDLMEILVGIGKEYEHLADVDRAALLEALGGKRATNALAAVLNNYEMIEKAYATAEGAQGSAAREQENYAQGVQWSVDRAKASLEELANNFLSSDLLKGLIEGANTLLQILNEIVSTAGSGFSIFTALAGLDIAKGMLGADSLTGWLTRGITEKIIGGDSEKSIVGNVGKIFNKIKENSAIKSAGTEAAEVFVASVGQTMSRSDAIANGFTEAVELADKQAVAAAVNSGEAVSGGFLSGLSATIGTGGMVALGVAGVAATAGLAYAAYKHEEEKIRKQADKAAEELQKSQQQVDDYIASYKELYDQMNNPENTEAETYAYKEQIYELQRKIIDTYGEQAAGVNLVNGELQTQIGLLENIAILNGDKNIAKNETAYNKASTEMEKVRTFQVGTINTSGDTNAIAASKDIIDLANKYGVHSIENAWGVTFEITANAEDAEEKLQQFEQEILKLKEENTDNEGYSASIDQLFSSIADSTGAQKIESIIEKWGNAYNAKLMSEIRKQSGNLVNEYADAVDKLNLAYTTGDDKAVAEAEKAYDEVAERRDKLLSGSNGEKYANFFDDKQIDQSAKSLYNFKKDIDGLDSSMFGDIDSVDFRKAMDDYIQSANKDLSRSGPGREKFSELDLFLRQTADAFGLASMSGEEYSSVLMTIAKALSDAGLIQDSFTDEIESSAVDLSDLNKKFTAAMTNIDNINAALVNSYSGKGLSVSVDAETGELTGDVITLDKMFKDIAGYKPEKLFKRMATGVKLNTKELRRLQDQQDAITKQEFAQTQAQLTQELTDKYAELSKAKTDSERETIFGQIKTLEDQISQTELLAAAYDGATSAYQKWLDAQSAGEEGAIYDNTQSTAKSRFKELYDNGLVGTNEYRALAELFTGQDYSTAGIDELNNAYTQFNQTIDGTNHSVADFFKEGPDGVNSFLDSLVDLQFAAEDADGNIKFDSLDISKVAEKFGTSVDVIEMNLRKLSDYGYDVTYFSKAQSDQMDKLDESIASAGEKMEGLVNKGGGQVDLGLFDTSTLATAEDYEQRVEDIKTQIQAIEQADINPNVKTEQLEILKNTLDYINEQLGIINNPEGGKEFTATNVERAVDLVSELQTRVQEVTKMGEEFELSGDDLESFVKGDEKVKQLGKELENIPDRVKTEYHIETDDKSEDIINKAYDGTLKKNLSAATVTQKVNAPAPQPSTQKLTTQEKRIVSTETNDVKNIVSNVSVIGADAAAQQLLEYQQTAEKTPTEVATEVVCSVLGIEDVNELSDAEQEVVGKTVKVLANVIGTGDTNDLSDAINAVTGKTVGVTANVSGLSAVSELKSLMDTMNDKTVTLTTKKVTLNEIRQLKAGGFTGTANNRGSAISHFQGNAYASGNWGTKVTQDALVGELGREILVDGKTGNWTTIGDHGAEFVNVPAGSIIFNHRQTEELLKNGYVNSRGSTHGRAFVGGTAFGPRASATVRRVSKNNSSSNNGGNNGGGGGNNNGGNNNSSKPAKTTTTKKQKAKVQKKDFDWIEKLLDYFNKTFENFKSMGEYYTTYFYQNREIDKAISTARTLITKNNTASSKYKSKAKSTLKSATTTNSKGKKTYFFGKNGTGKYKGKTVDQYIKLLNEGKLDFSKYNTDFISALEEASGFLDKATECKQQVNELKKEIYELSKQKLDNIVDDYDHIIDKLESANSLLEAQNKLIERRTKGKADLKYFNTVQGLQIKNLQDQAATQNKIVDAAKAEYADYLEELNKNIKEGKFVNNGEAQHEALTKLNEIREAAVNAELQVYEINDAIRELNWQNFKNGISMLDHLGTQLESTLSLFSDLTTFSDDGSITKAGVSQMNLYASQLANSRQKIAEYMNAIEVLREEEKNQNIDQKAVREELMETQESLLAAANDTKKYRDAILSLIKDGINKETEAMSKLIDKQKESLRRRKEENDYAKQVRDSQKEINELRRQEAALVGDTTQSANAQRIKLQADIRKKEEELAEKQRDHQYDMEVQGLDDLNTKFSENQEARIKELEASLEAQSKAIDNALIYTHGRYKETSDLLTSLTKEYGIEFESDVLKPWQSASDALVNYARATTPLDEVKGKLESLSATYNGLGNKVTPVFDETGINSLLAKLREAVAAVGKLGTTEIKTGGYVDPHSSDGTNKPQKEAEDMLGKQSSGSTKKEETKQTGTWTVADTKKVGQITKVTPDGKTVTATKTAVLLTTSGNTAPKLPATQTAKTHPTLAVDAKTVQSQGLAAALNKAVTDQAKKDAEAKKAAESKKAAEAAAKAKKDAENKKIKDIINSGATHKKSVSKEEAKKHVALWEHIAKTYGRTATNDMYKKIAGVLGIKVDATPTSAQKNSILSALKARGLVGGAYRVSSGGWHLTDEEGVGSEAILTKEGVLRQLDAKDTVFNAKQREQLWNLSKMDLSSLTDLPKGSIGGNVTMHYDSLLTVNGNVDDSTLPKLQELLKMASEYTQKDMKKGLMKLGHN